MVQVVAENCQFLLQSAEVTLLAVATTSAAQT